jgi:hypothetical protein
MAFQNILGAKLGQLALTTSYAILYRVPLNTRTYVKDIDICNTTSAAITAYVSLVISGGSPSASNALFYNTSIPAYSTMQWTGSEILNAGDTIQVKASALGCTINATGGEAT